MIRISLNSEQCKGQSQSMTAIPIDTLTPSGRMLYTYHVSGHKTSTCHLQYTLQMINSDSEKSKRADLIEIYERNSHTLRNVRLTADNIILPQSHQFPAKIMHMSTRCCCCVRTQCSVALACESIMRYYCRRLRRSQERQVSLFRFTCSDCVTCSHRLLRI